MTKWLIVGHGALASIWAHHLSAQHQSVRIITRANPAPGAIYLHQWFASATQTRSRCNLFALGNRNANKLHREHHLHSPLSLSIDTLSGDTQTRTFQTCSWHQVNHYIDSDTCILVMVKAWQLEGVIAQLSEALEPRARAHGGTRQQAMPQAIILSHNGIGAAESILSQKLQQGWPVYDLVTTQGAWRKHARHVVHAGAGSSAIGARQSATDNTCMSPPQWFNALAEALPPHNWEPDILIRRWHKLAINCAINPLATLAGQPNGVLAKTEYQAEIKAVCAEIATVAADILGPNRLSSQALEQQVHQVIEDTANNTCSMLQDVQQGNPTEIDFLNGYVAALAQQLGIATPVNARLTHAIRQLAASAQSDQEHLR